MGIIDEMLQLGQWQDRWSGHDMLWLSKGRYPKGCAHPLKRACDLCAILGLEALPGYVQIGAW